MKRRKFLALGAAAAIAPVLPAPPALSEASFERVLALLPPTGMMSGMAIRQVIAPGVVYWMDITGRFRQYDGKDDAPADLP